MHFYLETNKKPVKVELITYNDVHAMFKFPDGSIGFDKLDRLQPEDIDLLKIIYNINLNFELMSQDWSGSLASFNNLIYYQKEYNKYCKMFLKRNH